MATGDRRMLTENSDCIKETTCNLKLDIACGKNKKPGFTGVDIWEGADIVADLEKFPWPFEDDSVDEIFCSHYIEHTPDLISFVNELYRILKVGGTVEIIAPYYSSIRAWMDPTHLRAISENTFLYFNKDWRVLNKLDHYPIVTDFEFECRYVIDPAWKDKRDDELKFAIKHYINVVSDIHAILTKRKLYTADIEHDLQKAEEFWELGKSEDAAEICRAILARNAENVEANLMLGEHSYKHENASNAVEFFRQAVLSDGESLQGHVGLIRSLTMAGEHEEARRHLESIKIKDPDLAELIAGFIDGEAA